MAPQTEIPLAANVLGTIGTVCWCIQLLPQIWKSYRTKSTDALPALMLFLWAAAGVPMGIYAIVQNFNIPLQVQPQVLTGAATVCFCQKVYYSYKWRCWTSALVGLASLAGFAGIQCLCIFLIRSPYARGVDWPVTFMGVAASVFLAVGLILPYFELWKRQGRVADMSFRFLAIDMLGAIFSLLALVAQGYFDILGGVSYSICVLLEVGLFISHMVWRYRTRHDHRRANQAGMSYDEYIAERSVTIDAASITAGSTEASIMQNASQDTLDLEHSPVYTLKDLSLAQEAPMSLEEVLRSPSQTHARGW